MDRLVLGGLPTSLHFSPACVDRVLGLADASRSTALSLGTVRGQRAERLHAEVAARQLASVLRLAALDGPGPRTAAHRHDTMRLLQNPQRSDKDTHPFRKDR